MGRLLWFQREHCKVSNSAGVLLHVVCFKLPSSNLRKIFFWFFFFFFLWLSVKPKLELWVKFHVIGHINFFLLFYSGPLNTLEQDYVNWQLLFRENPGVRWVKVWGRITGVAWAAPSAQLNRTLKQSTPCRLLRDNMLQAAASGVPLVETLCFHKLQIEWWNTFKSLQQEINTGPSLVFQSI